MFALPNGDFRISKTLLCLTLTTVSGPVSLCVQLADTTSVLQLATLVIFRQNKPGF